MNSDELNKEQKLAMIGVALAYSEPQGDAPTLFEIDQWRSGLVAGDRANEILSFIANDHSYFKQWQDLNESQEWLDTDAEAQQQDTSGPAIISDASNVGSGPVSASKTGVVGKVKQWMTAANNPRYLGAVAAGFFGLLILPQLIMSPTSPYDSVDTWYDQYQGLGVPESKAPWVPGASKSLSAGSGELQSFRVGVAEAINRLELPSDASWAQWLDILPTINNNPCGVAGKGLCTPAAEQLQVLGQWSVLTHVACVAEGSAYRDEFLHDQNEVWALIAKQVTPQGPSSAADILAHGDSFPEVCARAQAGLALAVLRAE